MRIDFMPLCRRLFGKRQSDAQSKPTGCFGGEVPLSGVASGPCGRLFPSDGTLLFTAGKRAMLDSIQFDIVPGMALVPCGVTVEILKKADNTVASANPVPPTGSEGAE